jgi:hypothetical protein
MRTPRGRFEGKALDRGGIGTVPASTPKAKSHKGSSFEILIM